MYYLILLQQLIASSTHIIAKNVLGTIDPTVLLLLRASVASLSFVVFIILKREKLWKLEKKDILLMVLLGILNIPLNQFLFFTSLKHTTAPNVALAYALTPAYVLIISLIFFKSKAKLYNILGIAIAFGGTILILFEKGIDIKSDNFLGNILALLASISWAVYTIIAQKYALKYGAIYSTALAMVFGLIFFIPIFIIVGHPLQLSSISPFSWVQIIYLGVITSGLAYVIWSFALKKLEASKVSVFNNLQPVLTTVAAIFLFDHHLTGQFVAGGILTIIGVVLTQRG